MVMPVALTFGQLDVAAIKQMNVNVTSVSNLENLQYKKTLR